MAFNAPSASGSGSALTPAQLAAIQAAGGAAAAAAPGNNAQGFFGAYDTSLAQSGDFTPGELSAVDSQWNYGGNGTWNGAVPGSTVNTWDQNATTAIEGAAGSGGSSNTGLPTPGTAQPGSSGNTGITATAPAPLQAFGATPTVTPSYASAATVNPNQQYGYLQDQENANAQSLQPTFQNQDQTEQDQLAARGISSSGAAADLTNQLYGQQAATLAGMNAPAISQQAGYTQGDVMANQANEQQTNLFNAGEGTSASGTNAGYYNEALTGNATAYNGYLSTLESQGYNTSNEAYTAYLNSFGPNSGVTSGYNAATAGIGNTYGNVYSSATAGQDATVGSAFGAAGSAASAGAFSGAGSGAGQPDFSNSSISSGGDTW